MVSIRYNGLVVFLAAFWKKVKAAEVDRENSPQRRLLVMTRKSFIMLSSRETHSKAKLSMQQIRK